jgi:putative tricarboxylic transport membrane protein
LDPLINGVIEGLQPLTLLLTALGVVLGLVIAAIPGLTVSLAVVLLLPFTFYLPPGPSLGMLIGVFVGGMAGGAISAVLLNIPGNPASVITTRDGHPMAKNGRPDLALGLAFLASVIGGAFSLILLCLLAPQIARFALMFGAAEQAMLVLLGLTLVAGFSEGSVLRGLISAGLGLAIATVGLDPITASPRYTFGTIELQQGISFIPVMIGMFALPIALETLAGKSDAPLPPAIPISNALQAVREAIGKLRALWPCLLKSSAIGMIVGAIPGTGSAVAAILSYQYAERSSKVGEVPFGKGNPAGIIAPEAANSAMTGGALIPMLILGIPGDPVTAVMLGALMIQGLTPGFVLFRDSAEIVYGLFASFGISLVLLAAIGFLGVPLFVKAIRIPPRILMPSIVLLCVIGSYALENSVLDVWVMLSAGVLAFFMRRWNYPILPLLLALILGTIFESQFRMSLIIALGDPLIFLKKPISLVFVSLFVVFIAWSLGKEIHAVYGRVRQRATSARVSTSRNTASEVKGK